MSLIKEYTQAIIDNLPEWNYTGAKNSPMVQNEIMQFKEKTSNIDATLDSTEQLQLLSDIIQEHVPDNHVSIVTNENNYLRKPIQKHNQENLSFQNLDELGITDITAIEIQKEKAPWKIGTIKDKKTGVVSIPSFGGNIEDQTQQRTAFVNAFFQEKEKHDWQHIIFDFRGNTGGDAEIIKEIAERMYGQSVHYANKTEKVNTPASKQKQAEQSTLRDTLKECAHYRPQSNADRFSGSILILQDKHNASATEGAIFMLSQLPNSKTIGERTSGTFAGGATTTLKMEQGALIIGTEYRERYDKKGNLIKEKEGMAPDIDCSSQQAFTMALSNISDNSNNVISAHKLHLNNCSR